MAWLAVQRIGVWPVAACLKAGDTVVDVQAGRNAGMWSVGVAATGNLVGVGAAEFAAMPRVQRMVMISKATARLKAAGAHFVVDSVADLPRLILEIERRMARGERP
jgi:phosphonoacetaldehyde hydrolase